jgi:hypothetical protein
VKTKWINILQPLKHVGKKYEMLIIKMAADCGSMELVKVNLLNLCDINMILGLPCVLPILEIVNALDEIYTRQRCICM